MAIQNGITLGTGFIGWFINKLVSKRAEKYYTNNYAPAPHTTVQKETITAVPDADSQTRGATTENTNSDTKTKVSKLLTDNKITVSSKDLNDIIDKYDAIKRVYPNITENAINERIVNYAKGLNYHNIEAKFAESYENGAENVDAKMENQDIKDAVTQGDAEKFKQAYHEAAKQYIELYEGAKSNKAIDVKEFIAMEEKELGRKLTAQERKIVKQDAINRIAILDKYGNNNNKLDEDDIAAYLWAMSKINDGDREKTAHDITYSEWVNAQESIGLLSLNETLSKEELAQSGKFIQALKNGSAGLNK